MNDGIVCLQRFYLNITQIDEKTNRNMKLKTKKLNEIKLQIDIEIVQLGSRNIPNFYFLYITDAI